jgi:hypothetical protein
VQFFHTLYINKLSCKLQGCFEPNQTLSQKRSRPSCNASELTLLNDED